MLRSIGKHSGEFVESVLKENGGKNLQKRKVLSLKWKSEGVKRCRKKDTLKGNKKFIIMCQSLRL